MNKSFKKKKLHEKKLYEQKLHEKKLREQRRVQRQLQQSQKQLQLQTQVQQQPFREYYNHQSQYSLKPVSPIDSPTNKIASIQLADAQSPDSWHPLRQKSPFELIR